MWLKYKKNWKFIIPSAMGKMSVVSIFCAIWYALSVMRSVWWPNIMIMLKIAKEVTQCKMVMVNIHVEYMICYVNEFFSILCICVSIAWTRVILVSRYCVPNTGHIRIHPWMQVSLIHKLIWDVESIPNGEVGYSIPP